MSWYSGCHTEHFGRPPRPRRDDRIRESPARFVLILDERPAFPVDIEQSYANRATLVATLSSPGKLVRGAHLYRLGP